MLFLQLPPVHSPSTARPPDPDIRSRSSRSSLLPCYFCSSRPSTARPPPVHRIRTFALAPPSPASSHAAAPARPQPVHRPSTGSGHSRPQPVHRPSTGSGHSLSLLRLQPPPMLFLQLPHVHSPSTARPPDPDILSRSSVSSLLPCYFCSFRLSTARPPPVHRIRTFALAPPSLASSHAISAAPARPQPVHRPSTGSGHSLSLLRL